MATTRKVLVWRGPQRTVHELACPFITRRVNNGLVLEEHYDEVPVSEVPVDAPRCFHCAASTSAAPGCTGGSSAGRLPRLRDVAPKSTPATAHTPLGRP